MNIYDSHGILLKIPNYIGLQSNCYRDIILELPYFDYVTMDESEIDSYKYVDNLIMLIRPDINTKIFRQIVKFNGEIYEFKA